MRLLAKKGLERKVKENRTLSLVLFLLLFFGGYAYLLLEIKQGQTFFRLCGFLTCQTLC